MRSVAQELLGDALGGVELVFPEVETDASHTRIVSPIALMVSQASPARGISDRIGRLTGPSDLTERHLARDGRRFPSFAVYSASLSFFHHALPLSSLFQTNLKALGALA